MTDVLNSTIDPVVTEVDVKKYNENDYVYAIERGQTYRAVVKKVTFKVNDMDPTKSEWKYYVHFIGWSSRHDRWLSVDDIRPDSEEFRILADESKHRLEEEQRRRKDKKTQKMKGVVKTDNNMNNRKNSASTSPSASERKKRQRPSEIQDSINIKECCSFPFTLIALLKDDDIELNRSGYFSTQGETSDSISFTPVRKVHHLPSKVSVDLLMTLFVKQSLNPFETHDYERYHTFTKDITTLFNSMLPKYLLYPSERPQYLCLPDSDRIAPCKIYPVFHLLRMFVKLPDVLDQIKVVHGMEEEATTFMKTIDSGMIQKLIVFMQKHNKGCLKAKYRFPTTEEYTITEHNLFAKKQRKPSNKQTNL